MKTPQRARRAKFDPVAHDVPMRPWTVLAQDPSVPGPNRKALTTEVMVPAERIEAGPKGHRIDVIDYDATRNLYYRPRQDDREIDHFENVDDIDRLVNDPHFHQQNVYALAMATLANFQTALGRPVSWGFNSPAHQLKIAPHAFADANAYYSRESESLSFGYFASGRVDTVFTCLSHDIVVHETAHALLDGLRSSFMRPSHADQAAFHEGFADVVALLSILQSQEVVDRCLVTLSDRANLIKSADLGYDRLADQAFLKLAEQFGQELSSVRGDALRHSIKLEPSRRLLQREEFQEPHRRGEVLVAAIARSFLQVWCKRLEPLGTKYKQSLNRAVVAEEGAKAAEHLLQIAIRALDYLPAIDLTFADYLSALLTADLQLYPDDKKYDYRGMLTKTFAEFGIAPANPRRADGAWDPPPITNLRYEGLHFEQMQRDPNTLFRFIWENRAALGLDADAFTRVMSVRPCVRQSNDGLILRETIVEYLQTLRVFAGELKVFGIRKPKGLSGQTFLPLYGGGTLVFDEFGRLKFHIGTGVRSRRQSGRLQSLYDQGAFNRDAGEHASFAALHRRRMLGGAGQPGEQW